VFDQVEAFQQRLEVYIFTAVFIASMVFMLLCNLNSSSSFVLSEFDIYNYKSSFDYHGSDFLELRYKEMGFFLLYTTPFFVNGLILSLSVIPDDAQYSTMFWLLGISGL
jgi:hypothetical protein